MGLFWRVHGWVSHREMQHVCRLGFSPKKAAAVAGDMGGLSSLFLKRKKRRTFALYLMARLVQARTRARRTTTGFT